MAASPLPARVLRELTPSEADFQARVIKLAKLYSWRVYHTFNSRHSEKGMPDLILLRRPRLIFAELKVWPRLDLRPEQAAWLADLAGVPGVEAYAWRWVFPGDVMGEIAEVLSR